MLVYSRDTLSLPPYPSSALTPDPSPFYAVTPLTPLTHQEAARGGGGVVRGQPQREAQHILEPPPQHEQEGLDPPPAPSAAPQQDEGRQQDEEQHAQQEDEEEEAAHGASAHEGEADFQKSLILRVATPSSPTYPSAVHARGRRASMALFTTFSRRRGLYVCIPGRSARECAEAATRDLAALIGRTCNEWHWNTQLLVLCLVMLARVNLEVL